MVSPKNLLIVEGGSKKCKYKKRFGKWCTPESIKLKYYLLDLEEPNNNRVLFLNNLIIFVIIKKRFWELGIPKNLCCGIIKKKDFGSWYPQESMLFVV